MRFNRSPETVFVDFVNSSEVHFAHKLVLDACGSDHPFTEKLLQARFESFSGNASPLSSCVGREALLLVRLVEQCARSTEGIPRDRWSDSQAHAVWSLAHPEDPTQASRQLAA